MVVYFSYFFVVLIITYFTTKKSGMSMGWATFFSMTFSLLIAIIMVWSSGKKGGQLKYENKNSKWGLAKKWLCFIIGIILFIAAITHYPNSIQNYIWYGMYASDMQTFMQLLLIGTGFIGNGIYLETNADIIFAEEEIPIV